jgi:DNA-binding transcriptional MerR regulator/methylmalonyl-CoA mutase cobalamin-binding subunit
MNKEQRYGIKVVAQHTGLTPHVIRVWEKRYGAVSPARTETNRRLYSDSDIERLLLLHQATLAGHTIGQIATLPTERLKQILATGKNAASPAPQREFLNGDAASIKSYLDLCIEAVLHLDAEGLETALTRAGVAFSQPVLIDEILIPLIHRVGDMWREGTLRVMHEHLTTAVVRTMWGNMRSAAGVPASAPGLIVTTPAGQVHELGALIAAWSAAAEGWRVVYLGPNLPAEEIAAAAQQHGAKAVALSIVYPTDDPHLENEFKRLRRYLPAEVAIIVGGRAAGNYHDVLDTIGATRMSDFQSFRTKLESMRLR